MRIDWRADPNAPRCRVINRDTGKQIVHCAMADEETGEFIQWKTDATNQLVIENKRPVLVPGRANLEIVPLLPDETYLI